MKEKITAELMIFSKRAQAFLSTPSHLLSNNSGEENDKNWYWDFTIEKTQQNNFHSDKILTLFYFNKTASILESLYLETLCRMVIGKDILSIQYLSFRELENFLRDENHLPVFDISVTISPEECFKVVKNSLLAALIIKEIKKCEIPLFDLKTWEQLNLVEKNLKATTLIEGVNNLFSQVKPLQLALASLDEIAIIMNDFPIGISVIELLVLETLTKGEEISSLKVVAVQ